MNSIRDRLESRRTPRLQTSSVDSGDSRMQSSLHNDDVPWLPVATSMRDVADVAPTRKCHATNAGGKMKLLVINQKQNVFRDRPEKIATRQSLIDLIYFAFKCAARNRVGIQCVA